MVIVPVVNVLQQFQRRLKRRLKLKNLLGISESKEGLKDRVLNGLNDAILGYNRTLDC